MKDKPWRRAVPADGPPPVRMEVMTINGTGIPIDQAQLERRLAEYLRTDEFELDILDLAYDYEMQGLPVPDAEQLRKEAVGQAKECLKAVMICEAEGHLWKEYADPENGTSTLTCRRCGRVDELQWH